MKKLFKIIGKIETVFLYAESKGDAKRRFALMFPDDTYLEIIEIVPSLENDTQYIED